jgi:Flp pilus assembly protein TadB
MKPLMLINNKIKSFFEKFIAVVLIIVILSIIANIVLAIIILVSFILIIYIISIVWLYFKMKKYLKLNNKKKTN